MEPQHLMAVTQQFKQVFSEPRLNDLGKAVGFCQRQREITPYRLVLSLLNSLSVGKVKTLAELQRGFNALCERGVQYKPFHNQLSKQQFPEYMRRLCERLMTQLAGEVLRVTSDSPYARFERILIHDGTSFGLKSGLASVFPGRFTTLKPAAVELHVSYELLSESLEQVTLTADTEAEVHHLPEPASLSGGLLLADRMFFVREYLSEVLSQGGDFLVKAKGTLNPIIRKAYRSDGKQIKTWAGKSLKQVKQRFRRHQPLDLLVSWPLSEGTLDARLIMTWDEENNCPRYLVTSLSRELFSLMQVIDGYRLRWQIELLFKEWKSYANLHAYDTNNPYIAEGLIWASLCAALLKRYWAHTTQRFFAVPMSTQKVAMSMQHVLLDMLYALLHAPATLARMIERGMCYLAYNAQRAHPKRDKHKGRLKLGLQPVLMNP